MLIFRNLRRKLGSVDKWAETCGLVRPATFWQQKQKKKKSKATKVD